MRAGQGDATREKIGLESGHDNIGVFRDDVTQIRAHKASFWCPTLPALRTWIINDGMRAGCGRGCCSQTGPSMERSASICREEHTAFLDVAILGRVLSW
jgi:hypothetical protein